MKIDESKLKAIDLTSLSINITNYEHKRYFLSECGSEHYKLLAYFSSIYNNVTLLDIGTYKGCSALALAYNPTNQVKSFDIRFGLRDISNYPNNVEFIVDNIINEEYKSLVLSSKFIILDTDHLGDFEHEFYKYLKTIGYKGILLLDDIKLNNEMKEFWNSITEEKYDMSDVGHITGTGLVILK
jgi:hypothetical protein